MKVDPISGRQSDALFYQWGTTDRRQRFVSRASNNLPLNGHSVNFTARFLELHRLN
jgi:hypothetical protein